VRTLYDKLITVRLIFGWPFIVMRARHHRDWAVRIAQLRARYDRKLKQALTNRQVLWLYAPGPEDIHLATRFIRSLEPRLPNIKLIVSTSAENGPAQLQRQMPAHISKVAQPLDRRSWTTRALTLTRPEGIVLLGAELRPNFLWRARSMGIPVLLINPRITARQSRRYRRWGFLFRPLFASLAGACAQDERDKRQLIELGCRAEAVRVVGRISFEAAKLEERRLLNVRGLLSQLGVAPEAPILAGAATQEGEEMLLAERFLRLRERFPDLFLVLVPRQVGRSGEIGRALRSHGLSLVFRNEITSRTRHEAGAIQCLLVNTPSESMRFYESASIIFLGGSFAGPEAQDPADPGALGKALVFGPRPQPHAVLAARMAGEEAALQARTPDELGAALEVLLGDPARREQLSRNALRVVREDLGAIDRAVDLLIEILPKDELYVAPSVGETL
jgi:3-deoxy-D-manno-octulosonic-acid transferase